MRSASAVDDLELGRAVAAIDCTRTPTGAKVLLDARARRAARSASSPASARGKLDANLVRGYFDELPDGSFDRTLEPGVAHATAPRRISGPRFRIASGEVRG